MPKSLSSASGGHRIQLLERAELALRTGRFAEAEQLAATLLKANRVDTAATSLVARALLFQDRGADAVAPLEKALRRGSDPGLETLLGAALGSVGRHADAIEKLRRATAQRPAFFPAFQELAGQLAKTGRLDEAIGVIDGAVALAPDAIDLQIDLARLYLQHNDRSKARAILLRLRDVAPAHHQVLTSLARVLLLDGDYAAAAEAYRNALAYRPDDALTRADLAACLLELGERDAGESQLRTALRSGPHLLGRTIHALAASSHGRFFFRTSAVAKFLQG